MRRLFLVNLLVSLCLLANTPDAVAAYGHGKTSKQHHHRGQSSKVLRSKKKRVVIPRDLWDRVRAGMQIPRPSLERVQAEHALATAHETASTPASEPLSELKLITAGENHELSLSVSESPALAAPIAAPINDGSTFLRPQVNSEATANNRLIASNTAPLQHTVLEKHLHLTKSVTGQLRIHTQLGNHPELSHHNTLLSSEPPHPADKNIAAATAQEPLTAHGSTEAFKYERVNKFITWYKQHPSYLQRVTERAEPYLYHIVDGLNKKNLPLELALLPIVESAYQATAQSPKSAAGLWQFIPSTGNDFELGQSQYYDDRLDITASTHAATRFLSRLKQHFNGDWLLALAAYNCGQGAVDEAIKHNLAENLPTDFWALPLPEETRDYVPRLLALASIFAQPADHGLKLTKINDEPYFVKVKIAHSDHIKHLAGKNVATVAELAHLSYEKFTLLNPGFIDPILAPEGPFTFLVPIANAEHLHQSLSALTRIVATLQKIEATLPADISSLTTTKQTKYLSPFLSLDMEKNKMTPYKVTGIL
jgi:hypothetical protein